MSINLLVVNWNATSVDRQSLELRIDPDVKLHPFLRLVFERLEMDKLGLHEDQMELWVLDAPDVDNLSNIRYDGCDRRLTRLSGENRSLDSYVNPSDQNLVFIGRPSIIDINGRTYTNFPQSTLQQTNLMLQAFQTHSFIGSCKPIAFTIPA